MKFNLLVFNSLLGTSAAYLGGLHSHRASFYTHEAHRRHMPARGSTSLMYAGGNWNDLAKEWAQMNSDRDSPAPSVGNMAVSPPSKPPTPSAASNPPRNLSNGSTEPWEKISMQMSDELAVMNKSNQQPSQSATINNSGQSIGSAPPETFTSPAPQQVAPSQGASQWSSLASEWASLNSDSESSPIAPLSPTPAARAPPMPVPVVPPMPAPVAPPPMPVPMEAPKAVSPAPASATGNQWSSLASEWASMNSDTDKAGPPSLPAPVPRTPPQASAPKPVISVTESQASPSTPAGGSNWSSLASEWASINRGTDESSTATVSQGTVPSISVPKPPLASPVPSRDPPAPSTMASSSSSSSGGNPTKDLPPKVATPKQNVEASTKTPAPRAAPTPTLASKSAGDTSPERATNITVTRGRRGQSNQSRSNSAVTTDDDERRTVIVGGLGGLAAIILGAVGIQKNQNIDKVEGATAKMTIKDLQSKFATAPKPASESNEDPVEQPPAKNPSPESVEQTPEQPVMVESAPVPSALLEPTPEQSAQVNPSPEPPAPTPPKVEVTQEKPRPKIPQAPATPVSPAKEPATLMESLKEYSAEAKAAFNN
jgi:hypothetical protein